MAASSSTNPFIYMNRRQWVLSVAAATAALSLGARRVAAGPTTTKGLVRKRVGCSCCSKWVEHMKAASYELTVEEMPEPDFTRYKESLSVPVALRTCHTATINGYVVEGHVPPEQVTK